MGFIVHPILPPVPVEQRAEDRGQAVLGQGTHSADQLEGKRFKRLHTQCKEHVTSMGCYAQLSKGEEQREECKHKC